MTLLILIQKEIINSNQLLFYYAFKIKDLRKHRLTMFGLTEYISNYYNINKYSMILIHT